MKLTWFGGTTIRVHIGGAMLVADAGQAPDNIDRTELVSGADRVFGLDDSGLSPLEGDNWQPRKPRTALEDDGSLGEVFVWRLGGGAVLIDAIGEQPLVLATAAIPRIGRWGRDSVVVLFGDAQALIANGHSVLADTGPRLLVLGGAEVDIDAAVAGLRGQVDGTGLMALEAGLAVEV